MKKLTILGLVVAAFTSCSSMATPQTANATFSWSGLVPSVVDDDGIGIRESVTYNLPGDQELVINGDGTFHSYKPVTLVAAKLVGGKLAVPNAPVDQDVTWTVTGESSMGVPLEDVVLNVQGKVYKSGSPVTTKLADDNNQISLYVTNETPNPDVKAGTKVQVTTAVVATADI
ncbi:hypothetical protein [Photobacterium damselae]|uniref:Lipoprotein n=1 Tax=Photobacterium damselae TaxID=38293 RepID=A0ABD6X9C0_PHODM|nr:hypothetical protein [Photobacterium damselae]OBU43827.1 hypothetical protein AYY27_04335 [Photobacterium damselae]PSU18717.1 hypothetical protein CTM90_01670 [Photobacterium damselae]